LDTHPTLTESCFFCGAHPFETHRVNCTRPAGRAIPTGRTPTTVLMDDIEPQVRHRDAVHKAASGKVKSDGGSSTYYFLPKGATELNDLIEHKGMSFARGNLFKALYRLGEKEGTEVEYDLNKFQLFLDRLKEMNRKGQRL
jgi:hypothetical protein